MFDRFNNTLNEMRSRNQSVVETMAQGVIEMKDKLSPDDYDSVDGRIQYFLDRFYMNRISLRMLIHQHC
jgi:pyruvate dehydrogenase kinase 2/3/4